MKNIFLLIVILSCSFSAFSNEVTCSVNGTTVLFVNGIRNDSSHVSVSRAKLKYHLSPISYKIDRNSIVEFDASINTSIDLVSDVLEAGAHSIESISNGLITFETAFTTLYKIWFSLPKNAAVDSDIIDTYYLENHERLNKLLEIEQLDVINLTSKIKEHIDLNRKVLIISHSQGNFFANKALLQLKERTDFDYEKYKGIIGNIRVASPESKVVATYITLVQNSADAILKIPGAPNSNYLLYVPHIDWDIRSSAQDKKDNHSFVETYMFDLAKPGDAAYNENQSLIGLRKRTIKAITDTAAKLKPHPLCPYCTDTSLNRDFELERRFNLDGTLGGYVSTEAYVESSVYLSPTSVVCGEAVVINSAKILDDAIVEGRSIIYESATISGNAIVSDDALVGGNAVIEGDSIILNKSSILDNSRISENAIVLNTSQILGDSQIAGNATVLDSVMTSGPISISGNAIIKGLTMVFGQASIGENAFVSGSYVQNAKVMGSSAIFGNGYVSGGEIRDTAVILDYGRVSGNAVVEGSTLINGNSGVVNNGVLTGNARVLDSGLIADFGMVRDNAIVRGYSGVTGQALLSENTILHDYSGMAGTAKVHGNAELFGNFVILGNAEAFGNAKLDGNGTLTDNAKAYDNAFVSHSNLYDNARIFGNAKLMDRSAMSDTSYAKDSAQITGGAWLRGSTGVVGDAVVCGTQQIVDTFISSNDYCY